MDKDTEEAQRLLRDSVFKLPKANFMDRMKSSQFVRNLKQNLEENPIPTILAVAAVLAGAAKIIDAVGHARGSSAYARQVNHRINKR